MITVTYSGTTVTIYETTDIVKTKIRRFAKKFIPGASKLTLESIGGEGVEVSVAGHILGSTYLTDKDNLKDWHNADNTVTYHDEEGDLSCKITAFNWSLLRGTKEAVEVALTLNEV